MPAYTLKNKSETFVTEAKNISDLRHKLILQLTPFISLDVYSSTGRKMGRFSRGLNGGLWLTPSGKLYELFRDGTIRGEYR